MDFLAIFHSCKVLQFTWHKYINIDTHTYTWCTIHSQNGQAIPKPKP